MTMQTLGNGGMFMEGLGMMGQAALGSAQAMAQNVTNMLTNQGQKNAALRQQRANITGQGMTGTSMGGPNITGDVGFVGPDPSAPNPQQGRTAQGPSRVTGDVDGGGGGNARVTTGGGGGNRGGGSTRVTTAGGGGNRGSGGSGGRGSTPGPDVSGNRGAGGINFSRGGLFRGAATVGGLGMAAQGIAEGETGKGVGGGTGLVLGSQLSRMGGNPLTKLALGVGGAVFGAATGQGLGSMVDRKMAEATGQDPSGKYNPETQRYQAQQTMNTMLAGIQDINEAQLQNDLTRMRAQEPILDRLLNKQLVRQQAMNASLTNSYAMLGTLTTAGKMAQQGQREAGANFRTALQSNPYAGSVVQAPSISF